MIDPFVFWEYATFDDDGLNGIRDDAPEEIKKVFYEYMKEEEERKKEAIRTMTPMAKY